MNQKELLFLGETKLKQFDIEDAYCKCKILLKHILKQNDEQFIIKSLEEVSKEEQIIFETKLQELIKGKPIQYITKRQVFMGLDFYVDENVLIPQPDTEILVETLIDMIRKKEQKYNINKKAEAIKNEKSEVVNVQSKEKTLQTNKRNIKILDLCTGSGAIGITLAKYISNAQVTLSDISKEAIEVAKKNANSNRSRRKSEIYMYKFI